MRFNTIVEEMGSTLKQTSGSPILSEANDFSTNVLDARAGICATGSFILFHLGSATRCLEAILARYPEDDIRPGDAIIVNDPYIGSPHKPDIGVLTPIFYDGAIVNWVWTAAHMYDIGGISPGSFSPQVLDTYGEGLMIPPLKIMKEGVVNDDLRQIIEANSRLGTAVFNDIRCLVATNNVAIERIHEAIEYYGLETYRLYSNVIGVLSERAFRERIARIPDGTWRTVDWMEHDGHEHALYEVHCALTVDGDGIVFDFEGSAPQAPGPRQLRAGRPARQHHVADRADALPRPADQLRAHPPDRHPARRRARSRTPRSPRPRATGTSTPATRSRRWSRSSCPRPARHRMTRGCAAARSASGTTRGRSRPGAAPTSTASASRGSTWTAAASAAAPSRCTTAWTSRAT